MSMFKDDISLFNIRRSSDGSEIVTKTLLSGVLFFKDENASLETTGLVENDECKIYIPKYVRANKSYIDCLSYNRLSTSDLSKYYTFARDDYVAKGDITPDDLCNLDSYKNTYGNMFLIQGVTDYDFGKKMWFLTVK